MAYTFDPIFAIDPSNPGNVAANASVTIFAPDDATKTPLTLTTVDGLGLSNPVNTNAQGFGPAFQHATLDRVAWEGGGFTGYLTSYDGLKDEAVAARQASEASAGEAATSAQAAQDAAALVDAPADQIMADTAANPATAFATQLSATYDRGSNTRIYVSPDGDDTRTGHLESAPKKTFLSAVDSVGTGSATIVLLPGNYVMTSGITIDVDNVAVEGRGAVLDFTALTTGRAVTVTASTGAWNERKRHVLSGVTAVGPGSGSTVDGLYFTGPSATSHAAHLHYSDVNFKGFRYPVTFADNTYCTVGFNSIFESAAIAVYQPSGLTNGGERHTFVSCTIANSQVGVKSDHGSGGLHLVACSIDYNHRETVWANGAHITLTNCHLETGNANTEYPEPLLKATGNGGNVSMHGGILAINDNDPIVRNHIVHSSPNANSGGVFLRDVHMHNLATTTGEFATGGGRLETSGINTYAISNVSARGAKPLVADGGFETTTIVDEWFNGTSGATDRFTSTALVLASSTDYAYAGTRSLKVTKTGNGATAAHWRLIAPISTGERADARFRLHKPGITEGTITAQIYFAKVVPGYGAVVPAIVKTTTPTALTITLTAAAMNWVPYSLGTAGAVAPDWATHAVLNFNGTSWSASSTESIYLDDVKLDAL